MGIEEFLAITSRIPSEFEIYDKNLKTFEGLEDYIIKNVSEDRKADLEKLDRLKSNLLGWQTILLKLKGKPLHSLPDLEEKQQTSIIRLEAIIEAALKDLDFRIYRKRALPKEDNQLLPVNKDNTDLNPPIDPLSVINPLLHKLFFEKKVRQKIKIINGIVK
jgi:hypothetical protein